MKKKKKEKILKKPSVELAKPVSSKKLIQSFTKGKYGMFAREPKDYLEQPVQDTRNLFLR